MAHLAQKLRWVDNEERIRASVHRLDQLDVTLPPADADDSGLLILVNVPPAAAEAAVSQAKTVAHFGCRGVLVLSPPAAGDGATYPVTSRLVPHPGAKGSEAETIRRCEELWARGTPEDALFSVLFAVHFAVAPVSIVSREPAIDTPSKMFTLCTRCLQEALSAALDPKARACISCQSTCDVRDQTQMYRCTVTYESEPLAALVRCFERRGIFDCGAGIPANPQFQPLRHFRGEALTLEAAWRIMEGHWDSPECCSWRPVLGQNPAYDYFPCQFNSWYRDPRGNRGWYDPVFKVVTLDGSEVWRKRHYRVIPGDVPGSFRLSTEDNGISLREHWRIADADDGLAWAVFHYAGAAPSVGQSYSGSLLVTRDGRPPEGAPSERIRAAFRRTGVERFELYSLGQDEAVNRCRSGSCGAPPLTDFGRLPRYRAAAAA